MRQSTVDMMVAAQVEANRLARDLLTHHGGTVSYVGYVVVLLTDSPCEGYPDTKCIQSVIVDGDGRPFRDKQAADANAATWPEWCCPHIMQLTAATPPTPEDPETSREDEGTRVPITVDTVCATCGGKRWVTDPFGMGDAPCPDCMVAAAPPTTEPYDGTHLDGPCDDDACRFCHVERYLPGGDLATGQTNRS